MRALEPQRLELGPPLAVAELELEATVGVQEVEEHVGHRDLSGQSPSRGLRRVHPALEPLEARPPGIVEGHELTVEQRLGGAHGAPELAQLRVGARDVAAVAAVGARAAALDRDQRPHPVPFDLVAVRVVVARQPARLGQHRPEPLRQGLSPRVGRRVHPVDHPVLSPRLEQRVAPLHALAVEDGDHLVVAELLRLVGPAVPDRHAAGAVLAGGDVTREVEVLEGVVLDMDGEVVAARVGGNSLRHGPRDQHAVALQPQVPMQAARVVLLDDEPCLASAARLAAPPRLRRALGVPLGAIWS